MVNYKIVEVGIV